MVRALSVSNWTGALCFPIIIPFFCLGSASGGGLVFPKVRFESGRRPSSSTSTMAGLGTRRADGESFDLRDQASGGCPWSRWFCQGICLKRVSQRALSLSGPDCSKQPLLSVSGARWNGSWPASATGLFLGWWRLPLPASLWPPAQSGSLILQKWSPSSRESACFCSGC